MESFKSLTYRASTYQPTTPRSGNAGDTWVRLKNLILTGLDPQLYFQSYKGSLDLGETIATADLTGTLAGGLGSKAIVGTGTAFTTELRSGQFVFAGSDLLVIDLITDDTHLTICRALSVALVAATGKRMPVLFDLNRTRGTLIQGNAIEFDKGTIIGTGVGTLRRNGAALNATMVLAGSPKIAIYDATLNTYAIYTLGFAAPTTAPTAASVAGGTHGMVPGDYSFRMAPSRSATNGYGNPGTRVNFSIVNPDDQVEVDVSGGPAMDTADGQDGWDIYATQSTANANQGAWDFVKTIAATDIVGNKFDFDYLDAEIDRQGLLDFDNDPPGPSGFIAVIAGAPVNVSCDGKFGGSPGPAVVPFKPQNIEATPAGWHVKTSPPQDILSVVNSQARLYFPTHASLQTGVFADTGNPLIPPLSVRSYWNVGFANHQQLIFVANELIGYPHNGPTRSAADQESVEEQFFGDYVAEIIRGWVGGHVLVEHDPDPNVDGVCFFHPADSLNGSGFWTTRVLIWGLRQSAWIGDVTIESTTRDMIVCGVAKVSEHLEFLAGGRLGGGVQVDTFRWNTVAGVPVSYYAVPQFSDGGSENQNKSVRAMRVTGKLTSGNLQLHGFDSATNINMTDVENGANSVSGNIPIGTQTDVQELAREPMNFPNLAIFAPRISGTYSGAGEPDRIDEVFLEFQPMGVRR